MNTILTIIIICAILGALGALLAGGRPKDIAEGAASGAFWSMGCMVRLLLLIIFVLVAIWVISLLVV